MTDTPQVLSFPAILRNPGLKDRYAHLYGGPSSNQESPASSQVRVKKIRMDQNVGKRWVRRKDNAHFVNNPHVVAATRKDYILPVPFTRSTFPEPLPSYLPRTAKLPVATLPTRDPVSASAGRFSLSLKGMRRELRRAGGRAETLVRDVEAEMIEWLQGGVMLRPDESNATGLANLQALGPGREIGTTGSVREVSRTPLQLVWSIADDSFARYVVHCCARYHEVVSFSKGESTERLTYLLRPNVRAPDYGATSTLQTPPVTDLDNSSQVETSDVDSNFISDCELIDSDFEESNTNPRPLPNGTLDSVQEVSTSPSPQLSIQNLKDDEEWSVLNGDADAFGDESGSDVGQDLVDSVASLSLEDSLSKESPLDKYQEDDPDKTITQNLNDVSINREAIVEDYRRQQPPHLSSRRWVRSTSSPSRSPVRPRRLRTARKKRQVNVQSRSGKSFYDYLFT